MCAIPIQRCRKRRMGNWQSDRENFKNKFVILVNFDEFMKIHQNCKNVSHDFRN